MRMVVKTPQIWSEWLKKKRRKPVALKAILVSKEREETTRSLLSIHPKVTMPRITQGHFWGGIFLKEEARKVKENCNNRVKAIKTMLMTLLFLRERKLQNSFDRT